MPVDKTDDGYDFRCPEPGCGFTSTGWPKKADATARGEQHAAEHETGDAMPELADFTREG